MRLVLWILQLTVLFGNNSRTGGRCDLAGSVRLQQPTGGNNLCLKVLQGPPCIARAQF